MKGVKFLLLSQSRLPFTRGAISWFGFGTTVHVDDIIVLGIHNNLDVSFFGSAFFLEKLSLEPTLLFKLTNFILSYVVGNCFLMYSSLSFSVFLILSVLLHFFLVFMFPFMIFWTKISKLGHGRFISSSTEGFVI